MLVVKALRNDGFRKRTSQRLFAWPAKRLFGLGIPVDDFVVGIDRDDAIERGAKNRARSILMLHQRMVNGFALVNSTPQLPGAGADTDHAEQPECAVAEPQRADAPVGRCIERGERHRHTDAAGQVAFLVTLLDMASQALLPHHHRPDQAQIGGSSDLVDARDLLDTLAELHQRPGFPWIWLILGIDGIETAQVTASAVALVGQLVELAHHQRRVDEGQQASRGRAHIALRHVGHIGIGGTLRGDRHVHAAMPGGPVAESEILEEIRPQLDLGLLEHQLAHLRDIPEQGHHRHHGPEHRQHDRPR